MIGILDSGVGGLSVLREVHALLPAEKLTYVGDSAYCPYGAKSGEVLRRRVSGVVEFLLQKEARLIVLGCNSATIQAIHWCREQWPDIPFVGMEPGVKPAVKATASRVIGVLATEASLTGTMFTDLVAKHCQDCRVLTQACPQFVELVEAGCLEGPEVEQAVLRYAEPLVRQGADVLVLGCTHYPFLKPVIAKMFSHCEIIDTGEAVARQVEKVLPSIREKDVSSCSADESEQVSYWTSGKVETMESLRPLLLPQLPGSVSHFEK